jgi:hypothetical protein
MNINDVEYFYCEFDKTTDDTNNQEFLREREFLGGWTVSDRHPVLNLKRKFSKLRLPDDSINSAKVTDLRNILEKTIKKYSSDKNILLMSAGKDSTTLAHIFKKLDIPFIPLHLYSSISPTTEKYIVERISNDLKINTEFYEVSRIPHYNFKFWIENPYLAKKLAIENLSLQDYRIFTGEIGTGEMQVSQSLQYTAMMGYRPLDLSRWHVNVCGSYRRLNSIKELYPKDHLYLECVHHFEKRLNEWDNHPDVLNRVMFGRLQDEGSYRLFNYSLDHLEWVHPYAESEFISTCVNMPSFYKGNKNLFRLMYPDLTDIPWTFPKSGLGIPVGGI